MNIFVLDADPAVAATMLCDQHVGKMLLEACQLLCNAYREPRGETREHWLDAAPTTRARLGLLPYKHTHVNHPCSVWTRETNADWMWLWRYASAAAREYRHRFDEHHGSELVLEWIGSSFPLMAAGGTLRPFAQALPEQYRSDDAVAAYRSYYAAEKRVLRGKPVTWTRRDRPVWSSSCGVLASATEHKRHTAVLSSLSV